ncbi:MAG: ABC transporter ATP-binding protein [Spirochaetia bacterium]
MIILETKKLSKTYGEGSTKVDALIDADFKIEEGEFVAVVGPSGSGKSTLLHLLGGLDRPTSGSVYVGQKDIYKMSESKRAVFRRRQVGFVFQFYNLIPVLTARENIVLPLLLDNRKIDEERIDQLMNHLGLSDRSHHMPSELSGGQQQRVSIGRALAAEPAIILADEPTGNLDRKTGTEILELLRVSVNFYRQTVVMITHDMEAAARADRIVLIEDGILKTSEGASV